MSKNNNSVPDFAARFAAASTQSLVEEFNHQVGSNAWTSERILDKFKEKSKKHISLQTSLQVIDTFLCHLCH